MRRDFSLNARLDGIEGIGEWLAKEGGRNVELVGKVMGIRARLQRKPEFSRGNQIGITNH